MINIKLLYFVLTVKGSTFGSWHVLRMFCVVYIYRQSSVHREHESHSCLVLVAGFSVEVSGIYMYIENTEPLGLRSLCVHHQSSALHR
jgi:hypothetical protein